MISQALVDLWYGFGVAFQLHNLMWSFFGVLVGTYSSIFIAAPILVNLGLKERSERKAAPEETADTPAV